MTIIIMLLAISLLVALGFLAAFIWSVHSGQYEDDYTPSVRMLMDDAGEKPVINDRSDSKSRESKDGK